MVLEHKQFCHPTEFSHTLFISVSLSPHFQSWHNFMQSCTRKIHNSNIFDLIFSLNFIDTTRTFHKSICLVAIHALTNFSLPPAMCIHSNETFQSQEIGEKMNQNRKYSTLKNNH